MHQRTAQASRCVLDAKMASLGTHEQFYVFNLPTHAVCDHYHQRIQ